MNGLNCNINLELILVDDWEAGEVYPEGAREKERLRSPENSCQNIKPAWFYLFKRSDKKYRDQFWVEILAYHLGCMLGISVPPTYPAYSEKNDIAAALIEWFYADEDINSGKCEFRPGSSYFMKEFAEFDVKTGAQHNIEDFIRLTKPIFSNEQYWHREVAAMLFLDMLIGNTDRHQDNWGILVDNMTGTSKFAPWFDNGSSLGHERDTERTKDWDDKQLSQYVHKGKFHFRVDRNCLQTRVPHFELIKILRSKNGLVDVDKLLNEMAVYFSRVDFVLIKEVMDQFRGLSLPVAHKIEHERLEWMKRLLKFRFDKMKEVLK